MRYRLLRGSPIKIPACFLDFSILFFAFAGPRGWLFTSRHRRGRPQLAKPGKRGYRRPLALGRSEHVE